MTPSARSRLLLLALAAIAVAACSDDSGVATGPGDAADEAADAALDSDPALDADASPGDATPDGDAGDIPAADVVSEPDAAGEPESSLPPGDDVVLEVVPVDLWGQPLVESQLLLSAPDAESPTRLEDRPLASLRLTEPGRYEVALEAPEYEPLTVAFEYAGGGALDAVTLDREPLTGFEGVSLGRRAVPEGRYAQTVVRLYLGLRHRWFSASGAPPRRGNHIELLVDGEQAWARVAGRLVEATERIHAATWWWESDFELVRPPGHATMTRDERRPNTILWLLDHQPVTKRILVWQDNLLERLTVDGRLEIRGETPDDDFEFMGMTNSTEGVFDWEIPPFIFGDRVRGYWPEATAFAFDDEPAIASREPGRQVDITDWPLGLAIELQIASWHQKFLIIDGDEAFVGGMNIKNTDWDSSEHRVFDERRMEFLSSEGDRLAVAAHEQLPDTGPRKDYMLYLQGPIVADVDAVFQARWNRQIDINRRFSESASRYDLVTDQPTFEDGVWAQAAATMPAPFDVYSNLETHLNAIRNAEHFILVEDQYWRAPVLTDAIIQRMEEVPDLILVVVTKPIAEWTDPACEWTYRTDQTLRDRFPDRYFTFQLRTFDYVETWGWDETESRFVDMDTHSKLLLVDDVFASIGSNNKNNRGFLYEGELNVAILDQAWVTAARRRVLESYLRVPVTTDDPEEWLALLQAQAAHNDSVWQNWEDEGQDISLDGDPLPAKYIPTGFVYSLAFGDPSDCFIEGVGPDVMK